MHPFLLVAIIVGSVLVFVFLLLLLLRFVFAKVKQRAQAAIDARFSASDLVLADPMANFFGQQSRGAGQIRGNGGLALTRDRLWFWLVVPNRELEIPLASVTGVRVEKWFLRKSVGRPLLVVDFESGQGPDAAAWLVRDLERWREALERLRAGG